MRTQSCLVGVVGLAFLSLGLSSEVVAERAPEGEERADYEVVGEVDAVFERETRDQRQYVVRLRVSEVQRGGGEDRAVKPGEFVYVYCFQRKRTAPRIPAEGGHDEIPTEGTVIRAFVKFRNGMMEALYPDWFKVVEETPAPKPGRSKRSGRDG